MKLLVVLGACALLAIGQLDAAPFSRRPRESFAELVANRTAEMVARDENPLTLSTVTYMTSAMFMAAFRLHIQLPLQHLLTDVTYTASRFLTPERALADIEELQKVILRSLSYLDSLRPADNSVAINDLIDNFINDYTERAAQEFEKMHDLAADATGNVELDARTLMAHIDAFVAKIDSCLNISSIDFRQVFQCNKDYNDLQNRITPALANIRNAADKLYSDYWMAWNTFMSEFNSELQQVKEQIWKLQYSSIV